jgi:transposase
MSHGNLSKEFHQEFKEEAVRRLKAGCIYRGGDAGLRSQPERAASLATGVAGLRGQSFVGQGQRRAEENRIADLERKVGRQALAIDFLWRCFPQRPRGERSEHGLLLRAVLARAT